MCAKSGEIQPNGLGDMVLQNFAIFAKRPTMGYFHEIFNPRVEF